jgi:outer membrane protein
MIVKQFNRKFLLTMAFFCLLSNGLLKAQDTLTVSLPKAIEIAMSQSPTIKVANKEITRVDYSKKEKFAALFPTINGSGTYSRNFQKQKSVISFNGSPTVLEFGVDNSMSAGVSASLPIIAPTLWATLKMTEYDAQLALETSLSSKIALVNQVTKAYYTLLLAQDSYDVFVKSYNNTAENTRVILDKYKQGVLSEYEWIRADVQTRNAQSNIVSAQSAVNLSKQQLKMLMGLNMFSEIKVEGKLSDFEQNMYGDVMKLDTIALRSNTDLKQFDIKSKQLDQTLELQKTMWYPTLGANINYSYTSMGNDAAKLSDYIKFPASSLNLSLSIPIFQGGSKHYKYKQLKIQQDELKDQRDNLKKGIELQMITSLDNIKKAIEKIESNKKAMSQAEKAMVISKKRYEVGSGTFLDITNSELAYIQAGLTYNQSIYDYLTAKSDLEKLFGNDFTKK